MNAPTELRVSKDRKVLTVTFEGDAVPLEAELLRVLSPSAEVQGHAPDQRVTVPGKRSITISDVQPIGHYAIRVVFADGHDSGLFTWNYLAKLAREKDALFAQYLDELAAKGLSRD
ncbi:gamma-butyrobetaine hydroxylase-like domain-containing protein [Limoniibacter endophyticus]|uniref:Gamma-butyrobetaine hydroxylase-like N-terminal domain-containing protein n=1 Tax=Limoniibacter endophyticus TaxID=1565040 RepID=A0A8J3DP51_9HYPH|nr:DUF971 domain-containing protein [Limoniibacter endophyticus]GHC75862.1 hypothetical protein GCM10010136_26210 [Limoniibacter endophyticus]